MKSRAKSLKLPNGVFAGRKLPDDLVGEHQRPDYLWSVPHFHPGDHWTVGKNSMLWCDCVGEGKPVKVPEETQNDHAVNQVIMASMACIYHQISLGKNDPQVLAFTLNQNIIRFFVVIGQKTEGGVWEVKYFHVKDRNLDLSIIGDCVRSLTLGKVLRTRNPRKKAELDELKAQKEREGVNNIVLWWVVKTGATKGEVPVPERPRKDDDRNEDRKRPGGSGRDDRDGEKRGDKKPKGDGNFQFESQGTRDSFTGKGKTHGLSKVISMFKKLMVSILPLNYGTSYKYFASFLCNIMFLFLTET
jgi:hypothetical protein